MFRTKNTLKYTKKNFFNRRMIANLKNINKNFMTI